MVLGYKVVSHFTICIDFLLRVPQHPLQAPLKPHSREGQVSVICFPVVWQLAQHHPLLLKNLPSDKGSNPNRRTPRRPNAKIKLRPHQRRKSHESCYWVTISVFTVPNFSHRTILLRLHLTGTAWPFTKLHFQLFSYVSGSIFSGGSQWEPLGWRRAWRPLCQWWCDWKDTRVHTSPLGTYVHAYVPVGIQAQPHYWTWGEGAAAASGTSGYQIWTIPNTLSLPGDCLKL